MHQESKSLNARNWMEILAGIFMFVLLLTSISTYAAVQRTGTDFNHLQTGFALSGAHLKLECETCHVGGVFKGTPTACDGCHSPGRRVVATIKPSNHVLTTQPCDACHTNTITFSGIRFNHIGVQPKTCAQCHNGVMGPGKPSGHIATTSQCDSCHRNTTWIPAGFDHISASPPVMNRCSDCHNNVTALGKPSWHVSTALQCDSSGCHTNTNYQTFAGLKYDHATAVPGQCGSCHTGQVAGAPTQPAGHIPYSGYGCDNCHTKPPASTSFGSPAPVMNHGAIASLTCSKCHNGSYVSQKGSLGLGPQGKTSNHLSTSSECNLCHYDSSYTSFANAVMNHQALSPAATGRCNDCHLTGASGAKQKSGAHIPTTNQCDSCHSGYVSFPGTGATMNHAIEAGQRCDACHNGSYTGEGSKLGGAKTKPGNHIITALDCKSCHGSYTTWAYSTGEKMDHVANGNTTICKTCHDTSSTYLLGSGIQQKKLGNHEGSNTTQDCISCHANRYTSWNNP